MFKERIALIVILLLVALSIGTFSGMAMHYTNHKDDSEFQLYQNSKWVYNIKDFNENQTAYYNTVKYIKNNFQQFLDDNFFVEISLPDNTYRTAITDDSGEITYSPKQKINVIMTQEDNDSINLVVKSFENSGIKLKNVLLYKDRISFFRSKELYERDYALIYMYQNIKPDFLFKPNEYTQKSFKRIQDHWFHAAENPF